jgi:hypothetical protein
VGSPPGAGTTVAAVGPRLDRIAGSAPFAYGSIFLIQSKLLWGIWQHRDLSSGDTTSYFQRASDWAESFQLDAVWSPLYNVYWGSLQWVVHDAYAVTILHRALIALAASLLVLAVLRRLLSPGIAWVLAAWWTILPVNYDLLYEVHLFALLPLLVAVILASAMRGVRMRSAVLGVLLAAAALTRNEAIVAAAVWAAVWVGFELVRRRRGSPTPTPRLVAAFGVPILAVGIVFGGVALSSEGRGVRAGFEAKQESNFCQIYAYGYQQRNDDFTGNPWTDCRGLMERDFGTESTTLASAVVDNPGAVGEHLAWNAALIPSATQLLLFNRMSAGSDLNPDYIEVATGSDLALGASLLLLAFLIGGLVSFWRGRRRWGREWIRMRAWGWLALCSVGASAIAVMLVARPRPEFIYGFTVVTLAVIGIAAMAYVQRWPRLGRLRVALPPVALVLLVALPSHFDSGYQTPQIGPGRPLKQMVDRLEPFDRELRGEDVHLLATRAEDGCAYVGRDDGCTGVRWEELAGARTSTPAALERQGVDFVYADELDLRDPTTAELLQALEARGWQRVGPDHPEEAWVFLQRPDGLS